MVMTDFLDNINSGHETEATSLHIKFGIWFYSASLWGQVLAGLGILALVILGLVACLAATCGRPPRRKIPKMQPKVDCAGIANKSAKARATDAATKKEE